MFITTCNRFFHKHQRLTFIVIGFMIIVPFVLLWGPGDFLSRGSGRFRADEVGKMYGKTIPLETFMSHLRTVCFLEGVPFESEYRDELTKATLRRMCLLREAKAQGFTRVSDEDVSKAIMEMKVFQDAAGRFDKTKFATFTARVLIKIEDKQYGLTGSEFDEIIRENIAIERLEKAAMEKAPKPTDAAIADAFQKLYTRYQVQTCEFKPEEFKKEAEAAATDAAVKGFYAEKVEIFRPLLAGRSLESLQNDPSTADAAYRYLQPYLVPEQKRIRVAVFPCAGYQPQIKVTDDQVKLYFDQHKADYEAQVKAAHILLAVNPDAKPEEKAAKRKQLEELRAKIVAGAKFEELAEANSDCPSKTKGGDLGFFARGAMVKPFADAAFALPKGGLSGIVETEFGLHLIKCLDVKPARDLAAVKAEIADAITLAAAAKLAQQAADKFCDDVYRATIEKSDRIPASEVQKEFSTRALAGKITVKDSGWLRYDKPAVEPFGQEQALAQQGSRLTAAAPLSDLVIPGGDGKVFYVACFLESQPARLPSVDEPGMLAQARVQFVKEKETDLAQEKARKMFADLNKMLEQKTDFTAAAGTLKAAFHEVPAFSNAEPPAAADLKGVSVRTLLMQLTTADEGRVMVPFETVSGATLVYYKAKIAATPGEFTVQKDKIRLYLERQAQTLALRAFEQKLYDDSKTELADAWKLGRGKPSMR